ncbi:MAG: FAD-dependent protein [Bacteroidota bacterium]
MKQVSLKILPKNIDNEPFILERLAKKLRWRKNEIEDWRIVKRSIDARGKQPFFLLQIEVSKTKNIPVPASILPQLAETTDRQSVIIIGAGPAGYFAALELIELGYRPIVFDRGKDVRARRRDLKAIQQDGIVHPNSNYCFGEGGAGTYSDGKLYTRSHKRGKISKALQLLVDHGAKSDILIDAHPHIGSNKLPKIVANIRESILKFGGAIHFNSLVTDLILQKGKCQGVVVNAEKEYLADAVILATGHSARDIYSLLRKKGIRQEFKPFALGVRIEHPQKLIDKIQYNQPEREENLPAASYKLVCQVRERGVFSFCMCPGGLVVPAATAPGELVVNGMSMSRRDSAFANSGTVVAVEEKDLLPYRSEGIFAGLALQKAVEQAIFNFGDGSQKAPAQRLTDFVNKKVSSSLPSTSYIPGIYAAPMHDLLPAFVYEHLQKGVQEFGRKMRGYYTEEAVVIGTESRTSSPIRIPRNKETYMHEDAVGLFPCGEGAGFAGGIISAALDGQNVAKAVAKFLTRH